MKLATQEPAHAKPNKAQLGKDKPNLMDYQQEITQKLAAIPLSKTENFPPLTFDLYQKVHRIWNDDKKTEDAVKHAFIPERLTYTNLRTLAGSRWLNDEVTNAYIRLIVKRDKEIKKSQVFCFNTYFFDSLKTLGPNNEKIGKIVKRLQFCLKDCSDVFVPINIENYHWCFVQIQVPERKIVFHDSMESSESGARCFMDCIEKFCLVYSGEDFNSTKTTDITDNNDKNVLQGLTQTKGSLSQYTQEINKNFPRQISSDCGVYMLKGIEYLSRRKNPDFDPGDIPFFRVSIAGELIIGSLLN